MQLFSSQHLNGKTHANGNIKNNASLLTIAFLFLACISIYQNKTYSPQKQKPQHHQRQLPLVQPAEHQYFKIQKFWNDWRAPSFDSKARILQRPRPQLSQKSYSSNGEYRSNKSSSKLWHDQQYPVNARVTENKNAFDLRGSHPYGPQDLKQQQQSLLFHVDTSSLENQHPQRQMQHQNSNRDTPKLPLSSNKNYIDNSYSYSTSTVLVGTTSSSASSFPTEDPSWYGCQAECSIEYCNEYVDCSYNCRSVTFDDFAPTNCRLDNVCVCISER